MNHRSRRLAGPVVAVLLVVVVAVVLAVVGAQAQHRHRRTSSSAVVTTAPANGHPSTSGSSTTTTVPPPTTTAPANFAPSSVTPTSATYMVPSGSFVLNVLVNLGECWVYVRAGATSTTLFEQTVPTGQAANVTVTGPATVELGAPGGTTVTIDQRAVYLPPGFQSPFTMTLQPPAAG